MFSTCRYPALDRLASQYDILVAHMYLETSSSQQLKILLPPEPSVGQTESYQTMRFPLTATSTCGVPVLFYLPWSSSPLPHVLIWYQYDLAMFKAKQPQRPRRDSLVSASHRGMRPALAAFESLLSSDVQNNCKDHLLEKRMVQSADCAALAVSKKLVSVGLGRIRVLVAMGLTAAEHLQLIANAWMVVAIDGAA